jgi:hypothetical protein
MLAHIRRYTAAEALMDPWILNDAAKPWTPEFVQAEIEKLDSSSVQVGRRRIHNTRLESVHVD